MKVIKHSEEDNKLSFWLNDFKADFENTHSGIVVEYSFYTDDDGAYTSVLFQFNPESFKNETLIDVQNCDVYEIMDKIRQRFGFYHLN
jgi:hypothetical protein